LIEWLAVDSGDAPLAFEGRDKGKPRLRLHVGRDRWLLLLRHIRGLNLTAADKRRTGRREARDQPHREESPDGPLRKKLLIG
jgi:hypothetical protein